ncbi:hypothetical protein [Burkholderia lata]|uniref:Novel STAND NTPase 3 domain-containing protein n=1 Tax=Burkholderia lata (strain ATCC 17760 / DSM 23089 / LMG 22485 / NCIMB 9086 / R18194 / 383) TaxID=482957 RepID=Q39GB2_BURL3|nr:hypothetical protein [Burkholderia lata]ABB08504.1 hypothetical protein Bcep18194_A4909 [Burkholderia lata]
MSIDIVGQLKYRLQDHVCALLAVLGSDNAGVALQIEPKDGEDALLTLSDGANVRILEVQVKGAEVRITHDVLVDWLAHFPDRDDSGSLLERLVADPRKSVLFVASGRCNDEVVPHVVELAVHTTEVKKGLVTIQTERGMRASLQDYANATSKADKGLAKKRRAHIGKLLPVISTTVLKASLQRVLVAERLDEQEILRRIRDKLVSRHRVVPDRVEEVTRRITEIVMREKRTGVDVLPEVKKVIASGVAADPLVVASYVSRGEEKALLSQLAEDSALLLTGAPRVGKSFCARSLASLLQNQGYSVRICSDVAEADRYLCEPVEGNRVALVDDPFGGAHAADYASRELMLLHALIPKLGNGRRLIVSQAQDRLLEVSRCKSIDQIRIGKLSWVEMGIGNAIFLGALWAMSADEYAVPAALKAQVAEAIQAEQLDLEPGCLVYLAANHDRLDIALPLEEVVRYARQDSKSLGSALRQELLAPLMSALVVASTPALPTAEPELAFVLDSGRIDRPGESDVRAVMSSFGQSSTAPPALPPSYVPQPVLSARESDSLEQLELRRMVSAMSRRYTFSHPFYRASAESLIDAATSRSTEEALSLVERALFTIDADTARAAATNLGWIHQNLDTREGQQGVVDLAIRGLHSIFPVVRDLCFEFLVRRLGSLPVKLQSDVSSWVRSVTMMKLSYVEWSGDQPRIPAATIANSLEVDVFPAAVSSAEVKDALELLNSVRPDPLSIRDAAKVVAFLEKSPGQLTSQITARLLSIDVSMVRAPVVRLWLSQPRNDDQHLLQRIFSEQHPAVTRAAYQGVVEAWPSCDHRRRDALTSGLRAMADSPVSAAVLIDRLVVIARDEFGGKDTPWALLEALMPRVLQQLPIGASFRDERLYDVMDKAIGNISLQSLLEIVDRWIELVQHSSLSGIPSDYILGVSHILISGVSSESGERASRVESLLALPGTAARIRVVSDLVDAWGDLSTEERTRLLQHLATKALDEVWLKAAALTRSLVPAEIQTALLPGGVDLESQPEMVINRLPPQLLDACVQIFTGDHPAIYYVGAHGSRNAVWNVILRRIARMPTHSMFDVVWRWLLSFGNSKELTEVARELGPEQAERLAGLLLERKRHTSGEFMQEVWETLFGLPVDEELKSEWISQMAALAPSALDSLEEHENWIPESQREEFLSHFAEDLVVRELLSAWLNLMENLEDPASEHSRQIPNVAEVIDLVVERAPPKHWHTYEMILNFLKLTKTSDEALKSKLEERRTLGIKRAHERPERHTSSLENWNGRS